MKRNSPRFLILILPLFVYFSAAAAQQNQPSLVSFKKARLKGNVSENQK